MLLHKIVSYKHVFFLAAYTVAVNGETQGIAKGNVGMFEPGKTTLFFFDNPIF
jgi:hypothetical protein